MRGGQKYLAFTITPRTGVQAQCAFAGQAQGEEPEDKQSARAHLLDRKSGNNKKMAS